MKPILAVVHIYYPEMWDELKSCLSNITLPYDLYVTTVEQNKYLQDDIKNFKSDVHFEMVENRGYDVGPFIHILNQVNLDEYEYIVKLHTKSDKPNNCNLLGFNASGDNWRKELLRFMNDWSKSISFIKKNKKVGMIAGANVVLMENEDPDKIQSNKAKELLSKYGITINNQFEFVAGTMFLARSCLFKPIQHKFSLSDFEVASRNEDTLAHTFERAFGILVYYQGYIISDNMNLLSKIRKRKKIKYIVYTVCRFIFQKKISYSNILTIKFLRIPVYRRKIDE